MAVPAVARPPAPAPNVPHDDEDAERCAADDAVAVLVLADIAPASRLWGWSRLVRGRAGLGEVPGLRFAKLLGCGRDGGFGLAPSASRTGLFAVFGDETSADEFLARSTAVGAYRDRAREFFSVKLRAYASRGSWAGRALPVTTAAPSCGPIAALTRASIRPAAAAAFWRHAPAAERGLANALGVRMVVGVGEAPLLRQATFSIWDDAPSMDRYARTGAHLDAIRAAHAGRYFAESMFVRFVPSDARGSWKGVVLG